MPKIYEYFGLIFSFYSDDHEPIHVHVAHGGFKNKMEIISRGNKIEIVIKTIKGYKHLPPALLSQAERFVMEKEKEIVEKWMQYHVEHKKPKFERITKKI